jgi:sulfur-oxidizing protein SoxZ
MANSMKIKVSSKGDAKIMFTHPMTTYDQALKKTGDRNNAEFIAHISATIIQGDKKTLVYDMSTSQFLSKNPLIKFSFNVPGVKKGDVLEVTYTDNKGGVVTDSKELK